MLPIVEWGTPGECRGPLVVMCHWLGGSAQSWTMVGERLAERGVRCVAVDLPGFGAAAEVPGYSVREMADAVIGTVRALREGGGEDAPWLLMGHSMGGKITAVVAREAVNGAAGLQGLRGVVLVGASPPGPEPMEDNKRKDGVQVLGQRTGDETKDRKHAQDFVTDSVGKPVLGQETLRKATDGLLRTNKAAIRAWFETGSNEDWREFVGVLPLPALVLAGSEDAMLGPEAQRELVLPHFAPRGTVADLVVVEGAGHLPPLERPGLVAEHVMAFCKELGVTVFRQTIVTARFGALMESALVSEQTRGLMTSRLEDDKANYHPKVLDVRGLQVLRELARRIVPGAPFDLAVRADQRLAEGAGDGWRPAELPEDVSAWRSGLASLDAAGQREYGVGFAELNDELQDGLLERGAAGELGESLAGKLLHVFGKHGESEAYPAAEMKLWLEEVRGELAKLYMANPRTMERVGFTGFADEQGFTQIRLGEREVWER